MAPSLTLSLSQYTPVTQWTSQFESLQLPDKCQAVDRVIVSVEYWVLSTVIHMHMSATF